MWFTENPWPPMVIAVFAAVVFLFLWNANRRGLHFVLAVACLLAAAGIYLLERLIVTEGERLQQRVVQLCYDFRDKKPAVLDYVSDSFPKLKEMFSDALATVTIQSDLRMSDFQTTLTDDNSRGTVRFRANATINVSGYGDVGYQPAHLELVFEREKGEWKIIEIRRFNPINGKEIDVMQRSAG
jgi:hypothetical protein